MSSFLLSSGEVYRVGFSKQHRRRKNTPETVMVSGVVFSVTASDGFCPDCRLFLLFYGLRNSVSKLEHRHVLLSTRAVENGLVVAVEVHHGS